MSERLERIVYGCMGIAIGGFALPIAHNLEIPEGTFGALLLVIAGAIVLITSNNYK